MLGILNRYHYRPGGEIKQARAIRPALISNANRLGSSSLIILYNTLQWTMFVYFYIKKVHDTHSYVTITRSTVTCNIMYTRSQIHIELSLEVYVETVQYFARICYTLVNDPWLNFIGFLLRCTLHRGVVVILGNHDAMWLTSRYRAIFSLSLSLSLLVDSCKTSLTADLIWSVHCMSDLHNLKLSASLYTTRRSIKSLFRLETWPNILA